MEILEKLFGSSAKVKVMRLFIFNPDIMFNTKTVQEKARISGPDVRNQIAILSKIGLIKKRVTKNHGTTWFLDQNFQYLPHLKKLMIDTVMASRDDITRKVSKTCKLKALVFSGFFINNADSRVDLLIVAQSVQRDSLKSTIKKIEAEIGKEIRYVVLDQGDFTYRHNIGDRLVRDIFDYPHIIAYDRLGVA
jgi:hypothetical protein